MRLRLKDLGRWYSGGTPPKDDENAWTGDLPWLSAKDINSTELRPPTAFITEDAARKHSRVAPAGSLLVIVRGMALAHGVPVVLLRARAAFNQDLRALVPSGDHDARFLHFALIGARRQLGAHIDRASHGTARLLDSALTECILVPDRALQAETAAFLDRECAGIEELSAELSSFARSLRDGRQEMAGRELRNLATVPLRYRLRGIDQGWSPECENAPANAGEWGVLKVGCVNYGCFRASEHKRLPSSLEPRRAAEAKVGDLLVSRANTRELVGSAAVIDDLTDRRLMLSDKLYRLRTTADLVPEFAALALNSGDVRRQVEADTSGASSSMQNISQDLVRRLRMPDCSVKDQLAILARYGEMSGRVDAAVRECDATRRTLANYRDALITEAVTGQLDVRAMSESRMDESLAAVREGEKPEVLAR